MAAVLLTEISCSDTFLIQGDSMFPTFQDGERVKINRHPSCLDANDVIVFFFPYGEYETEYMKASSDNIMIKRLVGIPGDTVAVINGCLVNNRKGVLISISENDRVHLPYWKKEAITNNKVDQSGNVLNMKPIYIPKKGDVIGITDSNYRLYRKIIRTETSQEIKVGETYTFKEDYYFVCGDNFMSSWDSRQWGFLPQRFIIGKTNR